MSHFVASINIVKVTEIEVDAPGSDSYRPTKIKKRKTATIANLTISAPDLEALKFKISAHSDLVEDGGEINEPKTRDS